MKNRSSSGSHLIGMVHANFRRHFAWNSHEGLLAVLDGLPANVFVADSDLDIVYLSPMARRTLESLQDVITAEFGVDVADTLGRSMHRYHKHPEKVDRVLSHPEAFPHHASFSFGDFELLGITNGVRAPNGELVGYVTVLDNITERRNLIDELSRTAGDLSVSATSLSTLSDRLAETSVTTSDQAETMMSETNQLTDSLGGVSTAVAQATETTHEMVSSAQSASAIVDVLHESSAHIGDITGLITSVAEQTRMLALNATIEAARAGTAGQSFGVVASEVKDLADRARSATEQISQTIARLQTDITTAGRVIEEMVAEIDQVESRQEEIAGAIDIQQRHVQAIASVVDAVVHSVDGLTDVTSQTRESASDLAQKARQLSEIVASVSNETGQRGGSQSPAELGQQSK